MNSLAQILWRKKELISLLFVWLLIQSYLLITNGIKLDGEGSRFINEANNLISHGHLSATSYFMYFTEIFLIYLKLKTGFGYELIIFFQLLLNFFALFFLYTFLVKYYLSESLAAICCLLLIICYPYQIYNSFLYTESIFFSLSAIFSCFFLSISRFNVKNIFTCSLLLVLLCITRPTGIFFAGATVIYLFFILSSQISLLKRVLLFCSLSAVVLFLLNIIMGSGGSIDIILPFKDERIICDVPTLPYDTNLKTSSNGNTLYGLFYYIVHNFNQFSRLALLKSKAFFGLTRPFYSNGHNVFMITYFYPLYLLILLAIGRFKTATPVSFIYFISLTIIIWISVIFSCDEWHNRFFLPLTPFLLIPSLYLFTKKVLPNKSI